VHPDSPNVLKSVEDLELSISEFLVSDGGLTSGRLANVMKTHLLEADLEDLRVYMFIVTLVDISKNT
jgi:hypothetical protein